MAEVYKLLDEHSSEGTFDVFIPHRNTINFESWNHSSGMYAIGFRAIQLWQKLPKK